MFLTSFFILAILGLFLLDSWIFSHIYFFISHPPHTHTHTFLTYRHILLYFIILTFQSHYWVISRWFQPKTENQCLAYLYMLLAMLTYCIACCCSVTKLCPTPCNLVDCSTSGFLVFHCLPKFSQTQVHWVNNAIQPSHSLSTVTHFSSCPQSFQHQSLFQWVGSSYEMAKYWNFSFSIRPSNEYSRLISFRTDWFDFLAVQETLTSFIQHHSSKASAIQRSAFFMVQL